MKGAAPSIRGEPRSRSRGAEDEEGDSEETEVAAALTGTPEASEAPNLAPSNQPPVSKAEPHFSKMMEQMTQLMGQITQAVAPRDTSEAPAFQTPLIKGPDSFDGTKAYKLREFIQSCHFIFYNDPANFFSDRRKLFTLFDDPNEVRNAEQELENIRIKEGGQVSIFIVDLRSLISRIGDWGERAYIHVYRGGLASRLLEQLASNPGNFDSLQDLMDITLGLDTRYHGKKKGRGSHQEKKCEP
ncbi:hypothetical protein O181_081608 [Austropuccinia psidii MF-1]|uniref:Retrotransposon gag domain-containing protein n=1 Tax=Austropuccinia psidii MF-1 TaxID=1389203 RepID=A0A9Q3FKX6_9BASI|nr:hypothetical protein [Austropuccinia psidii MF-1]